MSNRTVVMATAGHVDHGKSTLVHALTGMDPDRLEAERTRGLTIELGFSWADFDGNTIAFVDVPGHEKFVTTMLSGIGAVPLALLVVAADDPWMPQAAEHLAALDALGVERGVVAVTRSDLADPQETIARVGREISSTSLHGAPIIAVSAVTGEGMEGLRRALIHLIEIAPTPKRDADVRLWVDRKFTIKGSGTVITGTLPAGTISVGDELASTHGPVRVRAIESLGSPHERVYGSARVALNLTGAVDGLRRGDALWSPDHWQETTTVDVRLVGGESLPPRTPMWHIGAHSVQARCRMIDDVHAQLQFNSPVPLRQGDRSILRDPGDRRLWGAVILDPDPLPIQGSGARGLRSQSLRARGTAPSLAAEVTSRGIVNAATIRRLGIHDGTKPWHMSSSWRSETTARIESLVRDHDRRHPSNPGLAPSQILNTLRLDPALPREVISELLGNGLRIDGGKVTSRSVELPERVERALAKLAEEFSGSSFEAPTLGRLRELGLTDKDLAAAARLRKVFLPAPGVVLPAKAPQQAIAILKGLPQPFTTSQAREALGTSRRVAIPLLDFLDRARVTRRLPDDRRELL